MANRFVLLLFACCLGLSVSAQQILYLKKYGTAKTKKVLVGDKVKIKTNNGETAKGYVLSITPDGIQVGPLSAGFDELMYIRTYDTFTKGAGKSLEYGAAFFGGIILFNSLITGASPVLTQGEMAFIGGFLVSGIFLELLAQRTYRLDKQWKTEVIIIPLE